MITNEILDKQFFSMTGREIIELFSNINSRTEISETKDFTDKKYVRGISGLAKVLNCGKTKAQEIRNSGSIDEAIIQQGRIIIFDTEKVIELLKQQ